jgi:Omp85 superfamily domain
MLIKKRNNTGYEKTAILLLSLLACCLFSSAQSEGVKDSVQPKDIGDVLNKIFKKKKGTAKEAKPAGFAILPSFGYNPSFGFVIGAKLSGGRQYGSPENTEYSIFGLEAIYTSKGIITAQARHNIFTAGDKLNWQGHWQLSRLGMIDYGVGTGNSKYRSRGFTINEFPTENGDSAFPIKYNYIRLHEKVYRKIGSHLFAGGGVSFDIHSKIKDEKQTGISKTPHYRYSLRNGFDPQKYSTNGFLLALQYNTREHPIRSYGGVYADVSLRINQRWMGSTKNSSQLRFDIRKYISLSKRNPENVLAFWHWASYKLSGSLPYLEMPSTASDTYSRIGRAYTIGRFKGPSYAYFESEYRFPISRNKLISAVCFFNMQSASDDIRKKIFSAWEPGAGAGLRILFQKESRTALCIDFAKGSYGSSGVFFGLSEVF